MNKDDLCEAFCGEIEVREVPAGLAVQTPFSYPDGDRVGFYVTRQGNSYRLEDSGLLIPYLEGTGVNLHHGVRAEQLIALLKEHDAEFDEDAMEVHSYAIREADIPAAAVRFVSLLLRLQDLQLLRPETVEKTFVEDAKAAIRKRFSGIAKVYFDASPTDAPGDYSADVVIESSQGKRVALYFGVRDTRVDEAVMLWIEGQWKRAPYSVAVMYENDKPPVTSRIYRRAQNRLDATLIFRGDEAAAMDRLGRIAALDMDTLKGVPFH